MKVLLTVPSLVREFGGPTTKARRLASELRGHGLNVRLVGAGDGHQSEDDTLGLRSLFRFHGTPIPSGLRLVASLVRGADVVHAMGYRDPVSTVACLTARRAGIPYVAEPVGMHRRRLRSVRIKGFYDRVIGARLIEDAAAVIATSSLEARELTEDGLDGPMIVTRPNGIDVESMMPLPERGSFRARHGVPDDASLVLSLGRIARKKGLVAFAQALAQVPDAWGAVVGPDDGDGALDELLRERERLRLQRLIVVPHGLWGEEKAQAYADADSFCLPSATENFGNAPAEAAALGVPVVISSRCGVAEFLDRASTVVVDHADVPAIARGIERSLQPEAKEAAHASSAGLRSTLDWTGVAERQIQIYTDAIAGRRPHQQPHPPTGLGLLLGTIAADFVRRHGAPGRDVR